MSRVKLLEEFENTVFDVLIIGGGINGAVSAAALSARGQKVALLDKADFASMTSQESSNMIWGGIKYLESREFSLVRELCHSRNQLMKAYPTRVREITYYTSLFEGNAHGPLVSFAGAELYWLMGSYFTRGPQYKSVRTIRHELPQVRRKGLLGGVAYSDAYLPDNDARFTTQFIFDALERGAVALNYVEVEHCQRIGGEWAVSVRDVLSGDEKQVRAKKIINACGPLLEEVNRQSSLSSEQKIVYSKGIHLTVPRLSGHDKILTFFSDDKRLFFVLPMGPVSCIGTTDTRLEKYEREVTDFDRLFILRNINSRLDLPSPLKLDDIIAERCGVRTLVADGDEDDWIRLSRKHVIEYDEIQGTVNIIGGKLTNCLNIGEEVIELLAEASVSDETWYGEPCDEELSRFESECSKMDLDESIQDGIDPVGKRLWRRYGQGAFGILEMIKKDEALGQEIIVDTGLLRAEVYYLRDHEMIVKLDDFLRRRTKISLIKSKQELSCSPGLREACEILFGDDGEEKYKEYFT